MRRYKQTIIVRETLSFQSQDAVGNFPASLKNEKAPKMFPGHPRVPHLISSTTRQKIWVFQSLAQIHCSSALFSRQHLKCVFWDEAIIVCVPLPPRRDPFICFHFLPSCCPMELNFTSTASVNCLELQLLAGVCGSQYFPRMISLSKTSANKMASRQSASTH